MVHHTYVVHLAVHGIHHYHQVFHDIIGWSLGGMLFGVSFLLLLLWYSLFFTLFSCIIRVSVERLEGPPRPWLCLGSPPRGRSSQSWAPLTTPDNSITGITTPDADAHHPLIPQAKGVPLAKQTLLSWAVSGAGSCTPHAGAACTSYPPSPQGHASCSAGAAALGSRTKLLYGTLHVHTVC